MAKDGAEFTDEGIYTITVQNKYTRQETVKKIYVGTNSILKAYVVTGKSISEIRSMVNKGAVINADGTITENTENTTIETTNEETEKETESTKKSHNNNDDETEPEEESTGETDTEEETTDSLPPVEITNGVFVNTDSVRFRSSPSTDEDNLICYFQTGHFVELLEVQDGWAHIRDNQPTNGRGQAQDCTNREGYVDMFLISEMFYVTVNTDNLRMRSTPSLENNDNIVKEGEYVLYFHTGHLLQVLEELDDWYRVSDSEEADATGASQHCTGLKGYIAKQYADPYKPGPEE